MKALVLCGLVVAAIFTLHALVTHNGTPGGDSIAGVQQQLQQGANDVEGQTGQKVAQVLNNVKALNQHLYIQKMMNRRGIRRLQRQGSYGQLTVGDGIQVQSGDRRVNKKTLQMAASEVQDVSLPILQQNVGHLPTTGTKLVLFSSKQTYAEALAKSGVPQEELSSIVSNTGGLTIGNDVWIPLYNLQDQADLANVLTHELTHVIFNQQGIGDGLPTWVNEGMAWHDGMLALSQVNPSEAKQEAAMETQSVQKAKAGGQLLPLSASEDDILQAQYNVEWTDYMAVQNLIQQHSIQTMDTFLFNSKQTGGVPTSFQSTYGEPITQYESDFIKSL